MRSSTVGAVLVFVVSGGALGVVTWREQREEAARRAEIEARDRRILEAAQASARAAVVGSGAACGVGRTGPWRS